MKLKSKWKTDHVLKVYIPEATVADLIVELRRLQVFPKQCPQLEALSMLLNRAMEALYPQAWEDD